MVYINIIFFWDVRTFCPEGGGSTFIRNISKFLPDYMTSHATRCIFTRVHDVTRHEMYFYQITGRHTPWDVFLPDYITSHATRCIFTGLHDVTRHEMYFYGRQNLKSRRNEHCYYRNLWQFHGTFWLLTSLAKIFL
jgi:hypothetical protein